MPLTGVLTTDGAFAGIGARPRGDIPNPDAVAVGFFHGMIDDFKAFDHALSDIEVASLTVCPVPPVASFTKTEMLQPGELVTFTDTSIGEITDWLWGFGDGTLSIEQNPTHTYNAPGVYTISLTVTDPSGSDTDVQNGVDVMAPEKNAKVFVCHTIPKKRDKTLHISGNAMDAHLVTTWANAVSR